MRFPGVGRTGGGLIALGSGLGRRPLIPCSTLFRHRSRPNGPVDANDIREMHGRQGRNVGSSVLLTTVTLEINCVEYDSGHVAAVHSGYEWDVMA